MKASTNIRDQIHDHLPRIRRIVQRIARNNDQVDDITQECCARILQKEDMFEGENVSDIWKGSKRSRKNPLFWNRRKRDAAIYLPGASNLSPFLPYKAHHL